MVIERSHNLGRQTLLLALCVQLGLHASRRWSGHRRWVRSSSPAAQTPTRRFPATRRSGAAVEHREERRHVECSPAAGDGVAGITRPYAPLEHAAVRMHEQQLYPELHPPMQADARHLETRTEACCAGVAARQGMTTCPLECTARSWDGSDGRCRLTAAFFHVCSMRLLLVVGSGRRCCRAQTHRVLRCRPATAVLFHGRGQQADFQWSREMNHGTRCDTQLSCGYSGSLLATQRPPRRLRHAHHTTAACTSHWKALKGSPEMQRERSGRVRTQG